MNIIIVYDSIYGNTENIARAIASGAGSSETTTIRKVTECEPDELKSTGLLIIGSPTQGGKATIPIQEFLDKLIALNIKTINIAVFDTRLATRLVSIFGYAAGKITDYLKKNGITLISPPEGFLVKGSKGPLKEGEMERAAKWGKMLTEKAGL